ncbi:Fusarisetin A cluster transcription factor fsa6 [Fusarium oxysporum f. sp. raphani]|uniref:Fusarisetin A cluster transcription factor fsa6 n=1 Tax=Fusarium oxysporum f. sp. raphani TaxID=96318 RepID=A0A8J5UMM3_FUSOX|nr:Fusarisetin A cluster transcription factor fsa6 [Fusarium oxysporum f. sp. raphani]
MIGAGKVEKRNRPPKSCEPCRTRKLKCNRSLPCDSCIKRNKQTLCHYASNADRHDKRGEKNESVADRLKNLESLIATVAQKSQKKDSLSALSLNENSLQKEDQIPSPRYAQPSQNFISEAVAHSDDNIASGLVGQVDSSHWSSILENIRAIRDELPAASPQTSTLSSVTLNNEASTSEADFDMRSPDGLSIEHILSALPPRQYESFWDSPSETSPVWIALLLALLSLSAGVYEISGMARSSQFPIPSSKALSKKTQECLLLSNYTAATEHAVEAFLLLLVGCWLRAKVSDTNLWFLMGKVVQLAICKGYHRDSTKVPGSRISPFDGEMRRRVWVCLYQLDSLMSFQMGLPSMIPSDFCDTELPRNLNQSDFYPGIAELPPSRPLSENTTISYTIVKASVMAMFKKVVRHTRSLTPPSFIVDEVSIIMSRTTIELLHLKSIIVLHRQYLTDRQDGRFAFSRKASLDAAERLLERQAEIHQITLPGGLLHDKKWMITSLTLSDFTLAAMVICLDLTISIRNGTRMSAYPEDVELRKYLAIVERAHEIWSSSSETSEGRIVSHALDSTIRRVNEFINTSSTAMAAQSWPTSATTNTETPDYLTHNFADQMADFDMIDSIDWSLLDNQIQDRSSIQDFDLDMWLMDTAGPLESL